MLIAKEVYLCLLSYYRDTKDKFGSLAKHVLYFIKRLYYEEPYVSRNYDVSINFQI